MKNIGFRPKLAAYTIGVVASCGAAFAQDTYSFDGEIYTSLRYHADSGLYRGQNGAGLSGVLGGRLSYSQEFSAGNVVLELAGRKNLETSDGYFDAPRAYVQVVGNGYDLLVGSNIVHWGVSESHQVVDVINQKYDLENPVEPESLGQPMVNLNIATGVNSSLSFFGLLGFREKDTGSRASRFRGPFGSNDNFSLYENKGNSDFDFALRYQTSQSFANGALDVGLSYFEGTNRDPKMLPGCINSAGPIPPGPCAGINQVISTIYNVNPQFLGAFNGALVNDTTAALVSNALNFGFVPYYQQMRQVGLELAYSTGDLQLTFEGAWRKSMNEDYFSGIAGVQYTFNDIGKNGGNLVAVGEYLYDDRTSAQPITIYDNDLFLGFRYGANDVAGTSLKGGIYFDLDSHSQIYSMTYSRRLSDSMRLDVSGLLINADDYTDPLAYVDDDSFLEFTVRYFF